MKLETITKTPLGSKKFIFASGICLIWTLLIGLAIFYKVNAEVLETMVWCCGMTSSLYLGGQSLVDSILRATIIKYGTTEKQNGPNN